MTSTQPTTTQQTTDEPKRGEINAAFKDSVFNWFDNHHEYITYQKYGYLAKAQAAYEHDTNTTIPSYNFKALLMLYRTERNFPLQYNKNKYYEPSQEGKRFKRAMNTKLPSPLTAFLLKLMPNITPEQIAQVKTLAQSEP